MIQVAFVVDLLLGLEVKVAEPGLCPSPHPSFVLLHILSLPRPIFLSVVPLHAYALSHFRLAAEESYPTRCVSAVSDLFPVDLHHFPSHDACAGRHHHGLIGLCCAGHHHGDAGTDQATEAQGRDGQADPEDPAEHLLAVSVEALLSLEE